MDQWESLQTLCRLVIGGDLPTLQRCIEENLLGELLPLAGERQLLPALACIALESPRSGEFPERHRTSLKRALLDNTRRNLRVIAQARQLALTLNHRGIRPLFFKGTAQLLDGAQQHPGFRCQLDIDLLVAPRDLGAASRALLEDGYGFFPGHGEGRPPDLHRVLQQSRSHHHLPPLGKPGGVCVVELHRHHLPRRFQRDNPAGEVFSAARPGHCEGAEFLLPSTEHRLIQLVLGNYLHDGFRARRDFPLRAAADYLALLDGGQHMDCALPRSRCGPALPLFHSLVLALTGATPENAPCATVPVDRYLRSLRRRSNSSGFAALLDRSARLQHLALSLRHNSGKLPAYLQRLIHPPAAGTASTIAGQ